MKQSWVRERMELLACGEALGYPRIGFRVRDKRQRIAAGQHEWERFARVASLDRLAPSLRIAKVLRDNNIPKFHPPTGVELNPMAVPNTLPTVVSMPESSFTDDIEPVKPLTKEERSARNKAAFAVERVASRERQRREAAERRAASGASPSRPARKRVSDAGAAASG